MLLVSSLAYAIAKTVHAVPPVLSLYLAQRPVTIDGSVGESEWTDALEVKLLPWQGNASFASGEAYWFAKHDGQFMYALLDFVSETKFRADEWGQLQWDKKHDASPVTEPDDWFLQIQWNGTSRATDNSYGVGTGTGRDILAPVPASLQTSAGMSASDKSRTPHVVIEMKIALSELGPGDANGVWGFAAAAIGGWDGTDAWPLMDLEYPQNNDNKPPSWGDLKLVQVLIPEFPLAPVILGVTTIVGLLLVRLVKARKRVPIFILRYYD